MNPSPEYLALLARNKPARSAAGDMWLCRRLGIVKVINGHTRGQAPKHRVNDFHLYHWKKPSLRATPCEWRDNDPNACTYDPAVRPTGEAWEYIGNMFEMLPYSTLAAERGEYVASLRENP